jgi:HlyD family secretion protein
MRVCLPQLKTQQSSQNDFAKLGPQQRASVTTDAYPERTYAGSIVEIAPEANRQKATLIII